MTTTKEQVSLSDFAFDVPTLTRNSFKAANYDISAAYRNKGRTRKTGTAEISMTFLQRREGVPKIEHIAIGTSRFKRGGKTILVINNEKVPGVTHTKTHENGSVSAFSRAHVLKLMEDFGFEVPTKPDTSITAYFKAEKIEGQPHVFILSPVSVTRIGSDGKPETKSFV